MPKFLLGFTCTFTSYSSFVRSKINETVYLKSYTSFVFFFATHQATFCSIGKLLWYKFLCACFYCTKTIYLVQQLAYLVMHRYWLFDEIGWKKRQAHRMQTKQTLVMLENLTQTVWTQRRYQQSYKCLHNVFVFFFVFLLEFWDRFKKSDDHGRANHTIAQISNSVFSFLPLYLFLASVASFSFDSISSLFFTAKI